MSPSVERAYVILPTTRFIGLCEPEKQAKYGILNISNLNLGEHKPTICEGVRGPQPLATNRAGWGYKLTYKSEADANLHKAKLDAINTAEWFRIILRDITSSFSMAGEIPGGQYIPEGDDAAPFGGSFHEK